MVSFAGRVEAQIKVPTGGAAVSASLGSLTSPVTVTVPAGNYYYSAAGGVSSILTTMQNLLNDNVQGYPQTAAAMQTGVGYGAWTNGWLFNIASGNDGGAFGGVTLTAVSTPTYGTQGPAGATTSTIDKAIGFDSVADAFDAGNTNDIALTQDLCVGFVGRLSSISAGDICGKFTGAGPVGWEVYCDGSLLVLIVRNGGSTAVCSVTPPALNTWFACLAVIDRGSNNIRIGVCPLGGSPTAGTAASIAGFPTLTNAGSFIVGNGNYTGSGPVTGLKLAGFYVGTGVGAAVNLQANLSTALQNFANAINASWTVSQNQTDTGRVTISNSFWSAYVQFISTQLRDVLGYAYDFDYPQTAAQMATALGYGTWTNGAGWLCNEASGSLAAVFGSPTLSAVSSPLYSFQAARGGADKAVGFDSALDAFGGGSVFNVGATDDLIIVWVGNFSAWPAAQSSMVSKGWAPGWILNVQATGEVTMSINDGTTSRAPNTAANGSLPREWHVGIAVIDRSTAQVRVGTYGLTSGTNTTGTAASTVGHGSLSNATAFQVGADAGAVLTAPTTLKMGAVYVVSGPNVATGLSANLSTALSNFATYMKSQTTTQSARGIWIPDSLLTVKGDPRRAPLKTDKRESRGPTGYVFSIIGNSFPRHLSLMWDMVTIDRVWDAESTNENNTWEEFVKETQFAMGSSWFTAASLVQIYDHNNVQVGVDGAVAGWYMLGLDSIEPEKVDPQYTGLWRIEIPEISAVGS